jgi:hypothetical protein
MPESERKLATRDMPLRVDGDAHDVISSQQPIEGGTVPGQEI